MSKLDQFMSIFEGWLTSDHKANPGKYRWNIHMLPTIVADWREKLAAGNVGHVSLTGFAIQQTCKELKIKCTYKAIKEHLAQDKPATV